MTMWRKLRPPRRAPDAEVAAERADPGPSIGERLRARRRERGLSFEDVERDTRINPLYLEALEDEDWQALPAPVYARGFMRSYARYLGLDPDAAVAAVPSDLPRPHGLEPLPGLRRSTGAAPRLTLPAVTPTTAAVAVAAVVVLFALLLLVPRLGRGRGGVPATVTVPAATAAPRSGVFPPVGVTVAPAAASATGTAAAGATVPAYAPGTVPNFTGVREENAAALLAQLHLQAVPIEAANALVAAGLIFDQSPAPGTPVQENEAVTLFVSKGSGN